MRQLRMVHPDPASVPPPTCPEGIALRTYRPGDERAWADIINATDLAGEYDVAGVRSFLTARAGFEGEGLFFACDAGSGRALATACAWRVWCLGRVRPTLHMVAAVPRVRGRGLGRLVCQAVVNYLGRRGHTEVLLSTDDHRIPAIVTYLQLGFVPMRYYRGEDHTARWEAVFEKISGKCGPLRFAGLARGIRVGVLGLRRGTSLAQWLTDHPAARLAAGCDLDPQRRKDFAERFPDATVLADYAALLDSDADAVIVANDCPEHAPAAIRALESGRDVLSEVTAFHTPAEGVELVEAVERTGRAYMMGENCLYDDAMLELAHRSLEGELGGLQYAEGDYVHDIRPMMRPEGKLHWRAWMPPGFYCTHPLGPILRAAGCRPRRVVGMHARSAMTETQGGIDFSSMLIRCTGGAVVRIATAFAVNREPPSLWVCYYGTKASLETDRWERKVHFYDARNKHAFGPTSYRPTGRDGRSLTSAGHSGADARMMEFWVESLVNGLRMPIDACESADMTLPGILAYRSSLRDGEPVDVPDFRDPAQRDAWRDDRAGPDPENPLRMIPA